MEEGNKELRERKNGEYSMTSHGLSPLEIGKESLAFEDRYFMKRGDENKVERTEKELGWSELFSFLSFTEEWMILE